VREDDPLLRFRPEFPILEKTVYLISNSLGAMPRGAEAALAEYAGTWKTRGVRAWAEGWWEMSVSVGDGIAPLLGARAGSVSMLPSVTVAQAVVLSCFDFRRRPRVILVEGEFPSVRYVYDELAVRLGAEIVVVPSPERDGLAVDEEQVATAIDDRTSAVVLSHVLFKSAYVTNLTAIVNAANRHGAEVVLDVYQSVGTLPVDVEALGVRIAAGGVLKWLCGGPGAAFLYVHPELRKTFHPALTGWFAHRRPFSFEDDMDLRDDAFRFLLGTPAIPALYAAREGPKIIRAAGPDAIRAKSGRQTGQIIRFAQARGFAVSAPRDPERRGGTVAVDFPHALEVSRELNARDVCVDFRPGVGIRLSPHFYNTDGEIAAAFSAIDEILGGEQWKAWVGRPMPVT